MKREIVITSDGSTTIHLPEWNEHYHSKHGAIQEANHVFIKNGLHQFESRTAVSILEIGFGTGLNCLISYLEGLKHRISIDYTGIELYPVQQEELTKLNYPRLLQVDQCDMLFNKIHALSWNQTHSISTLFKLTKRQEPIEKFVDKNTFDLIYFDAFGPRVQPELWTKELFDNMYQCLKTNGILVTYSAKGSVRRTLQELGFNVERLKGPPGKREMLRASK